MVRPGEVLELAGVCVWGGLPWKCYAKEISAQNVLSSGRARQGCPVGCSLGGEIRPMGYPHEREGGSPSWLTGRGYVGTSPLGVPRMVYLCPPGGV